MPYFQIDHIKLRSILADAYLSLRQRRDIVIAAFAKLPDQLATDEDIELAQGVVRELNETRETARRDRLSDQKPFKDASATVQEFFDDIEKPLQSALSNVLNRIADVASSRKSNFPADRLAADPVVKAGEAPVVTNSPLAKVLGPEIELVWSIKEINRATLDLEKLRNYLTEASLLTACRKHLKEHGSEKIRGVWYKEVAQPKK
jgi:hypothetical protein